MELFIKWKFPLFVGAILSVFYLTLFENRAYVELEIQVPQKTWVNIYWTIEGKGYSKWRRARVRVSPDEQQYHFYLTNLKKISRLRIDPHMYKGEIVLKKLLISQSGLFPLLFETGKDFNQLKPLFDIGFQRWEKDGLHIYSVGNDPQLELAVTLHDGPSRIWPIFIRIVTIFFFVFFFFLFTKNYRTEERFIPLFFAMVFSLIIVMASITVENVHPDEYVHLDAADYYKSNYLPPKVDDPDIRHTYSVYGVSRLNGYEISYFLTGKLSNLLQPFHLPAYLNLRMFNVFLFSLLLLYVLRSSGARMMASPLLISPQIWYLFSYCNSDAFGLVVAFIVACQFALPRSMLNTYLLDISPTKKILPVILLSSLVAFLFLLKKNYLFFVLFIAGYFIWKVLFQIDRPLRRQCCKKVVLIICIGLILGGIRMGANYAVNGMDYKVKKTEIQNLIAAPMYNTSTPLEKKHPSLYRKARGDTLKKIVVVDRWFEKTYRSAFGSYGYFTAIPVDSFFNTVRPVAIALFLLLGGTLVLRGGIAGNLLFLLFLSCSGTLIGASLYHSWTMDFQAQGRYLIPVVPMFCMLLYHARPLMHGVLYKILISTMFILSVYSFVFVAILKLPKIS
jgi:hypothetical protein